MGESVLETEDSEHNYFDEHHHFYIRSIFMLDRLEMELTVFRCDCGHLGIKHDELGSCRTCDCRELHCKFKMRLPREKIMGEDTMQKLMRVSLLMVGDQMVPFFYLLQNDSQVKNNPEEPSAKSLEDMNLAGWRLESVFWLQDSMRINYQVALFFKGA